VAGGFQKSVVYQNCTHPRIISFENYTPPPFAIIILKMYPLLSLLSFLYIHPFYAAYALVISFPGGGGGAGCMWGNWGLHGNFARNMNFYGGGNVAT